MAAPDYDLGEKWDREKYHHDDKPYYQPDFVRSNYNRPHPGGGFAWIGSFPRGRQPTGLYAGRGPRNYRRSDERIESDVNTRLTQHGQLDASNIVVQVKDGEVTLSGTVDSRASKRLADDIADGVPGVKDVHNELRIGVLNRLPNSSLPYAV